MLLHGSGLKVNYYVDFITHPIPPSATLAPNLVTGGHEFFIKPKATPLYLQYNEVASNFKFTNCASAFSVAVSWINELMGWCHPDFIGFHGLTIQRGAKATAHGGKSSKDLDASKVLTRVWRVNYQKEANDFWLQVSCCHHFLTLLQRSVWHCWFFVRIRDQEIETHSPWRAIAVCLNDVGW